MNAHVSRAARCLTRSRACAATRAAERRVDQTLSIKENAAADVGEIAALEFV